MDCKIADKINADKCKVMHSVKNKNPEFIYTVTNSELAITT